MAALSVLVTTPAAMSTPLFQSLSQNGRSAIMVQILPVTLHIMRPRVSSYAFRPMIVRIGTGGQNRNMRSPLSADPVSRPQFKRSEEHTSELQSLRHLVCRL